MSIKEMTDKILKAIAEINEMTNNELEEMLTHSIIEMWEGNRYLVQKVTKHKPMYTKGRNGTYGPAFL